MNRGVTTTSSISINAASDPVALCAVMPLADGAPPDWVHLLPAGDIRTLDGRGPYRVADMTALAAASLAEGDRLVLDENHSTDLAAPEGRPAPAMGWIISLEARSDGLWGQVEWTPAGQRLVRSRAYRGISPVLRHDKQNRVEALLRASLVNRPNIQGLESLNQETSMDLIAKLRAALGLADTVSEDALLVAVTSLHQASKDHGVALNSIASAAGLQASDAHSTDTIVGAIGRLRTATDGESITALQAQITTLTTDLNAEREARRRGLAETYVDGAIATGKVGVKPLRDHYVTRHMIDPAAVEREIGAMPALGPSGARRDPPREAGDVSLNAEEAEVARQLGIAPDTFAKSRDSIAAL